VNEKVPFTLVCIAVLAFACGPRPHGESATDRAAVKRNVVANADAPLTPSLDIDVNDDVRFAFHVANDGSKKLELLFADGRTHDVVVLDSIGREVWRWSEGRLFTQAVQSKVLRVSDRIAFEEAWNDARPGTYTAVATLASSNFPIEQRVAFTVR
jgi:hypothetical protein